MNHMQRYLAEEFAEEYHAGRIPRRLALKLIASFTGSLLLASNFLAACAPPPATPTATPSTGVQLNAPTNGAPTRTPPAAPTSAPTSRAAAPTVSSQPAGTVAPAAT